LSHKNELFPPQNLIDYVGGGDADGFIQIGKEFLQYFTKLCGLKQNEKVLEIGCGAGRMAIPLTNYLTTDGLYEGLDIHKESINWCRNNISSIYPNFHFTYTDIINGHHNPNGKYPASEYEFPYGDEYFDFIFLTSVFTHLRPLDMENYFSNISRVLKKGGKCLITFFLLNEKSKILMNNENSLMNFNYSFDGFRAAKNDEPEFGIAYEENYILKLCNKNGFEIISPIYYGSWCGLQNYKTYQDIINMYKK